MYPQTQPPQGVRLCTADCDEYGSNGFAQRLTVAHSATEAATFTNLPSAFCPLHSLQEHGYIFWVITGTYTTVESSAHAPDAVIIQPRVNHSAATGLPAATTISFTPGALADNTTYNLLIKCLIAVVGDNGTSPAKQLWEIQFTLTATDTAAAAYSATLYQDTEIDPSADRFLNLGMAIVSAGGNANDPSAVIKSITGTHVGQRYGI